MRSDQLCSNCEWWDDREHVEGFDPRGEKFLCLRWPGGELRTEGTQRCWQWAAKVVDLDTEEIDPEESELEKAIGLVREAGLPTGHAETCMDLVRELLEEIAEQRRTAGKATGDWAEWAAKLETRWDRARLLLYHACMSGLNDPPEGWDEEARQLLRERIEDSTPG